MSDAAARPVPGAAVVCLRGEQVLLVQRALDRARWLITTGYNAPPSLGMEIEAVAPAGIATGAGPAGMFLRAGLRDRVRGLYVITDDTLRPGRTHVEVARAALEGGAHIL